MADQAKARATETETSQVKEANEKVSEAQDTKENQKDSLKKTSPRKRNKMQQIGKQKTFK